MCKWLHVFSLQASSKGMNFKKLVPFLGYTGILVIKYVLKQLDQ